MTSKREDEAKQENGGKRKRPRLKQETLRDLAVPEGDLEAIKGGYYVIGGYYGGGTVYNTGGACGCGVSSPTTSCVACSSCTSL